MKSIIFNSESVRGILEDRKTQTRRVIVPQPNYMKRAGESDKEMIANIAKRKCPYGKVGDTLWVREGYRIPNMDIDREQALMVYYCAARIYKSVAITKTEMRLFKGRKYPFRETSGRFMYKSLARIFLEVTGIRVEILKEISENDIICEGFNTREDFYGAIIKINRAKNPEEFLGKWVWVIEFKRIEKCLTE